jgi:hypothetical protein
MYIWGPSGGGGVTPMKAFIEIVSGSQPSSAYSNGRSYTPLTKAGTANIVFEFVALDTKTYNVTAYYAMSTSNSGNVSLKTTTSKISAGDAPNPSPTVNSNFVITPGNDTNMHSVGSSQSSTMSIAATSGDHVYFQITRNNGDGGDTHTGDMNIIAILLS